MNTLKQTHRPATWLVALAAFSCAVGTGRAFANESDEVRSVKVSFADLNLSTPAGATTLYHRIESAARTVCGPAADVRDLPRYYGWRMCYRSAIADAVAKVNSPMLTEVHRSKTGGPGAAALLSQRSGTK